MRIYLDPRQCKIILLSLVLTSLPLFWGTNDSYSCTDAAGICQNIYDNCTNQLVPCQNECNAKYIPYSDFWVDCYNDCAEKYGNVACLAKYNPCMTGCYWKITSTAGSGGSISSTGAGGNNSTNDCPFDSCALYLPSYSGGSQTYNMNPNSCYQRSTVYVDGISQGVIPSKIFYNNGTSTQNHSITANFSYNCYTVTPSPGPNGSMSPSTPQPVAYGLTISFTMIPSDGYRVSSVTGCGGTLNGNIYTTGSITGNCTVSATFSNMFIVTPLAGTGGNISPSTPQSVTYGSNKTFGVGPHVGYSLTSVSGCAGTLYGTSYVTGNITGDCTVTATFSVAPPALLTVTKTGGSGTVTSSPAGINCGDVCTASFPRNSTVWLTATPAADSGFSGFSGMGVSWYGETNMGIDRTVTAQFYLLHYPDYYGAWNDGYEYDTCDSDEVEAFTCPPSASFSCIDTADDEYGSQGWRDVQCNP